MTSPLLFTEGFVNEVLERNSFKTPVFSNFFLKRFRALSIDSFSLMLIISMFSYLGCKYSLFEFNLASVTLKLPWRSPIFVFLRFLHQSYRAWHRGKISPPGSL